LTVLICKKTECVFLNGFEAGSEARTPDEAYATQASEQKLAA